MNVELIFERSKIYFRNSPAKINFTFPSVSYGLFTRSPLRKKSQLAALVPSNEMNISHRAGLTPQRRTYSHMSRKNIDDIVLKNLALVPATVYNLAAFLSPNATTVKNALNWSDRLIKRLAGQRKIRRIPIKGQGGINNKKNSFYSLTHFGARTIEYNKYQYRAPKSIDVLRHEVGLADILLGFIYGFPDYKVEIDYKRIFKLKRGVNYTPDAVVRLKNEETTYKRK